MTRTAAAILCASMACVGVLQAGMPAGQLPPSVRGSAPKAAPLTEEERKAQCTDLTQLLAGLRKDPTWLAQPLADREVRQLQRALDSLGCPDEGGGLSGTWRIEGPPSSGNRKPLNGTMVLKRIAIAVGAKAAEEQWGSFSMRHDGCIGVEAIYRGTIVWDHGSFFHEEYCCWQKINNSVPGSPPSPGEILLCGYEYSVRGRFRDGANSRGGGISLNGSATLSGEAYPDFGRTINITAKRGGK
jgi:hypothetical protein